MAVDKDRLYKKLERVGEQVVRENLASGVYGENRRELVEEWLEQFQDVDEAVEDEALELASEEDRPATPEPRPRKWYQRLLGI